MPDLNRIYHADARTFLASLPPNSIHACITSPPYFGLRDYGTDSWTGGDPACQHEPAGAKGRPKRRQGRTCAKCGAQLVRGQIGLEGTLDDYVHALVDVFDALYDALRVDGTLWLVLGDAYATGTHSAHQESPSAMVGSSTMGARNAVPRIGTPHGLKTKDMVGVPWRVALALQRPYFTCKACGSRAHADRWGRFPNGRLICPSCMKAKGHTVARKGWYLRSDIVWEKPNAMPESANDRPTKSHDFVFLLTKSHRYYYDGIGIREAASPATHLRLRQASIMTQHGGFKQDLYEENLPGRKNRDRRPADILKALAVKAGYCGPKTAPAESGIRANESFEAAVSGPVLLDRNRRDVWQVLTEPCPVKHFATYPQKLVAPMVVAGTSEKGVCPTCGAPWKRRAKHSDRYEAILGKGYHDHAADLAEGRKQLRGKNRQNILRAAGVVGAEYETVGWAPSCVCGAGQEPVPAIIVDPFMGWGTTAKVALHYGRNFLGSDLSAEYIRLAEERIHGELTQLHLDLLAEG